MAKILPKYWYEPSGGIPPIPSYLDQIQKFAQIVHAQDCDITRNECSKGLSIYDLVFQLRDFDSTLQIVSDAKIICYYLHQAMEFLRANLNLESRTISTVIRAGTYQKLVQFLDQHPYASENSTPLMRAIVYREMKMVKLLCRRYPTLAGVANSKGHTPLIMAMNYGVPIYPLLQAGAKNIFHIDPEKDSVLSILINQNKTAMLEYLIGIAGLLEIAPTAILNFVFPNGNTLLHLAAKRGYKKMIRLLVRLGCSHLDTPNQDGKSPLLGMINSFHIIGPYLEYDLLWSKIELLRALGTIPTPEEIEGNLKAEQLEMLSRPIPEDRILELRFQTYFQFSLTQQLLNLTYPTISTEY